MDQDKTSSTPRTERDVPPPAVSSRRVPKTVPPAALFVEPAIPASRVPDPEPSARPAETRGSKSVPSAGARGSKSGRPAGPPVSKPAQPAKAAVSESSSVPPGPNDKPAKEPATLRTSAKAKVSRRSGPSPTPADELTVDPPTAPPATPAVDVTVDPTAALAAEPTVDPTAAPPQTPAAELTADPPAIATAEPTAPPQTPTAELTVDPPAAAAPDRDVSGVGVADVEASGGQVTSKKTPASNTAAKKTAAVKALTPKTPPKKTPPKGATPERATPKKTAPEKAPVRKAPAKKATAAATEVTAAATEVAAVRLPDPEPSEAAVPVKVPEPPTVEATVPEPSRRPVPEPVPAPDASKILQTLPELWAAVRQHPRLIAAAVAVAAVGRYAPSAREQADWLRRTYPRVEPDRLASIAVRTARQRSRWATGTGIVGGPLGATAGLSTLTWAQARLILDVAAIYGADPADPQRAVDILVLLRFHPDQASAAWAVATIIGDTAVATIIGNPAVATIVGNTAVATIAGSTPGLGATVFPRARGLARRPGTAIGVRLAMRLAGRLVPGAGLVLNGLRNANVTDDLATRTTRFYRDTATPALVRR